MADINLLDLYINDEVFSDLSEEALLIKKQEVLNQAARLEEIKKEIEQTNLLERKKITTRTQLHHVLGAQSNNGLTLKYDIMKSNNIYMNKIGKLIYEAYNLTSKILQDLGIISKVSYTFTYHGETEFYRAQDLEIDPEKDIYFEIHRGALTVRLRESQIKNKILAQQINHNANWVSKHYNNFIKPLQKAENKSSKFKINWGVASEAFERHWEELQHSIDKPKEDRFGGVGHIWYLYRISSGNDPYYTGPDTANAQVKNANASIISNADTVLNTLQAVLKLINTKTNSMEEAKKLQQQYALAFKQKEAQKKQISRAIWDAIDQDAQQLLMKEFQATSYKIGKNTITFN